MPKTPEQISDKPNTAGPAKYPRIWADDIASRI